MEQLNRPISILNLAGELSQELSDYFSSRNISVVNPESEVLDWTHLLTKNVNDFRKLAETYNVTEKSINIISLTKVSDLQNFTVNNGNLILSDIWFKGAMGPFIMDKYFQSYGGISLGDNYPTFTEIGSFNIVNPFNTGEYLDRMVQKAFESGTEALTIKTYFDHLVMFVAGLKNKGKAGLPFEVTYGVFDEIFAVQIHFFSKALGVMDVATSLRSKLTKKAEEYYLNIAVQSADFFDFSYMPQVNKVIITALWTKDQRVQFENRGLMFASLVGGAALAQYNNEGATSSIFVNDSEMPDLSGNITIPETIADEDGNSLIKGNTLTDDENELVKGGSLLEEIAQTVKGKVEQEKDVIKIFGDKLDVDKTAFKIASSIDESTKEKNLSVRSLGNLPAVVKTGLFDFAKGLGKDVESLTDSDLDRFQLQKVPELIKKELLTASMMAQKKDSGAPDLAAIKDLESRLTQTNSENEKLKSQLKTISSEVRILKESRNKLAEMSLKAKQAAAEITVKSDDEDGLRKQFQQKLNEQKSLNEAELKKLALLLERESKIISDLRQEEMKSKKLELESKQKDTFFAQELEKAERQIKGKDLILIKTKETLTKLVEKKDRDINDLKARLDSVNKAATAAPSATQAQALKDLEKQNQNLAKQVEQYKNKITTLTSNMQPSKSEESIKEEYRKLQMMSQQMKNQLDMSKKEVEKLQAKSTLDNTQLTQIRLEKTKLEDQLKKAVADAKPGAAATPASNQNDQELKRISAHNQLLETQVKDLTTKIMAQEAKLAETLKPVKPAGTDEGSKVRVTQLETSVKKLTQDLVDAKNQVAEAKKETNKLRQEKTALQNQLDKLKKEADKASKKPGGKAA